VRHLKQLVQVTQDTNADSVVKLGELGGTKATPVDGVRTFEVTLNPEHLGKVEVQLTVTGMKMSVVIVAANEAVRELLSARENSVRVMVALNGVTVERYEVVTAPQTEFSTQSVQQDFLDREGGNQGNHANQGNQDSPPENDGEDTVVSFAEFIQQLHQM